MFVGHFAVAYASKRFAPRTSLGTLFLAVQWADLLWPALVLLGIERVEIAPGDTATPPLRFVSYPYTHSLIAGLGWALVLAGVYYTTRHYRRGALVIAGVAALAWVGLVAGWLTVLWAYWADAHRVPRAPGDPAPA